MGALVVIINSQNHAISLTCVNDSNKYAFKNSRRKEPLNRSTKPFFFGLHLRSIPGRAEIIGKISEGRLHILFMKNI